LKKLCSRNENVVVSHLLSPPTYRHTHTHTRQVIGFPSQEFKGQEFSKDEDIAKFLDERLGINRKDTPNLIVLSRSKIRRGKLNPIWKWLKDHSDKDPDMKTRWNFSTIFIVKGNRVNRFDDVKFDEIEAFVSERTRIAKM